MLTYRTRKNAPIAGKPKVYFAAHPADFELYFEPVTGDLLRAADCAVWYETPGGSAPETEELDLTVNTMQLIVFAVTHRFLTEANPARDVLLPYAQRQHIPVLPIVAEAGDEIWQELNRISGGIQTLDRLDTDETAIPYREKLERYLRSVLVDDRLAALVRDAFDAYVFLSYRKKDRKYANELMRRIHENRRFRDIAIWFDEYLVPGEEFTRGIELAMAKSPIFTMVVTPHLLEPENYVLEHEYKDARAAEKIIVPVEMAETNHADMYSCYQDLPDIQRFGENETEQQAFHARFLEALKRAAIAENDDSPEHNFHIGLAYLSGIDVEVNRERAAAMIERASCKGCAAATQKLVYMYRNGEGVAPDAEKELDCQYRLTQQRKAAYAQHPDADLHLGTATQYFRSLIDLSDMLRQRDMADAAIRAAEDALALYDALAAEVGVREARRDRALLWNRLGGICRDIKRLKEARRYYTLALEAYESASEEITTRRARRDLSIGFERLGGIEKAQGDLPACLHAYQRVLEIRKMLVSEEATPRARRDLSVIYTKLASLFKELGELQTACDCCTEAVALDEQLEAEVGTLSAKRDLSISAEKLARLYRKLGKTELARPLFEKTVALRQEIYQKTGSEKHREELEYALHHLKE